MYIKRKKTYIYVVWPLKLIFKPFLCNLLKRGFEETVFFKVWHYPEVVYEKLAMSLSVVCEKGEMKQWRHAKLKSSVEDISRKPWNSDDLTTEVGRRGFNYIMSEHWPSWLLNVDWFTSLFFCKSQTTGFHTTCSNVKVSHWRCRWSIFFGGGGVVCHRKPQSTMSIS